MTAPPIELFYSYAHEDEKYRIELEKYLAYLRRKGKITTWYDRRILAGSRLDGSISEYLERADIILCLLSADFANSDYVNDVELVRALERRDNGEARVIGVVVRPVPPGGPLEDGILIPTDALPIIEWNPIERGYLDVVDHLQRVIEDIRAERIARGATPSAPEPVWSVPRKNPTFVGRDEPLEKLAKALKTGNVPSVAAIVGLPGVGKSQLAFEYANRNAHRYQVAWSIRAEDTESIVADLSALAEKLGIAGEAVGRESERSSTTRGRRDALIAAAQAPAAPAPVAGDLAVNAVMQWLSTHANWLLIFDNAASLAAVSAYIPRWGSGHVIITSREDTWSPIATTVKLGTFEGNESEKFLLSLIGANDSPENKRAARRVAATLGDMPLALEHAASFVTVNQKTLAAYQSLLDAVTGTGPALDDPVGRIAATWAVTLDAIGHDSPAAQLFGVCAWLAPEDIPRSIFSTGAKLLGAELSRTVSDPLAFADAITLLVRYGLVRVRGDAFTTHRLVQRAAQDRLAGDERRAAIEVVTRLLDGVYPDADSIPDPDSWVDCERFLPHVVATAGYATAANADLPSVARSLWRVGDYQAERARYLEAQSTLERALATAQVAHGLNHPLIADIQNSLGNVLLDSRGDYDGARRRYESAFAVDTAIGAEKTHDAAIHLNNIGFALEQQGQLKLAQSYYNRSIEIELALGERGEAAKTMLNIGSIHETLGEVEDARRLYEQAIEIHREAHSERGELADGLSALGTLLLDQGNLVEGAARLTEALDLNRSVHKTEDHPEVARNLTNLARVALAMNKVEEARRSVDDAIAMYTRVYGPDGLNPSLGAAYYVLGEIHERAGRLDEARQAYETALRHDEAGGDARSLGAAEDLEAVGRILLAQGNKVDGIARQQHAYRLYVEAYGPDNRVPRELSARLTALGAAPSGQA